MGGPADTFWKTTETLAEQISQDQFLKAVDIWNNNPRAVNQRVHSCIVIFQGKLSAAPNHDDLVSRVHSFKTNISDLNPEQCKGLLKELGLTFSCDSTTSVHVFFKKLLPKSIKHFSNSFELVTIDKEKGEAFFMGLPVQQGVCLVPKFPYKLVFKSSISLQVPANQDIADPSLLWIKNNLLPQLNKWSLSHNVKDEAESSDFGLALKSHGLISTEKYAEVYQTLKAKYGQQMVKVWPECTDPAKFVYEDVAIASYILLLWEEKPTTFVDLGCGNGLLVHILNSEGHNGIGIDLRSRKIWDIYPPTTKLQVQSITPSDNSLFPDTEWLIGNHSDELTPWIPVIAARSSQICKFFVLPCCPYDFDGLKYRRKNSTLSQYSDFLLYIKDVSEKCGFKAEIDRLRIPSTKRICLVGRNRTYTAEKWNSVNSAINLMIEEGCRKTAEERKENDVGSSGDNGWVSEFKPREATEKVRNCTQLESSLINDIVTLTANHLLVKRRSIPHQVHSNKMWNAGGIAALGEIIPLIGSEKLKKLKSECGGLQTLLKNHHQVFLVEKGTVQLRTPINVADVSNSKVRVKQKRCWFFNNHPDGCLLDDSKCAFRH